MKKELLLVAFLGAALVTNAQVKVGDNPTTINSNSVLEIESTNKGMLLPRVELTGTTSFAPLTAHVAGMTVYNTATATDVTPGYYYNDGAKWVKLSSSSDQDLRKLGRNHISSDAGFGSTGTSLGSGFGQDNIAIGEAALNAGITVNANTAIGSNSMSKLETGKYNTGIGRNALKSIVTGEGNTAIGWNALDGFTTGNHNIALGVQSFGTNLTGNYNIGIGWATGLANTGSNNMFLGTQAGYNFTGSNRLMIDNTVTGTNTPLIDGDFATKILKINNTLQVADLASAAIATTGNRPVVADANGQLMIGTATAAGAATTSDNGLTKTADNIQLGGALIKPTTISTDATNNLVVNATGIGGNNVELNQGVNVLATSINSSTAKAIALRGRVSQTTGAIGQARGVSGAANITGGDVAGTATGGYFNTAIGGTTLPATNGLMTGVAADAETLGSNTNSASSTFAGARFGADVTAAPTTHSAGVVATAVGSTSSNVGIAASVTIDAATLTGMVNALPAGTNAANYSYAPAGASNFASYTDGNVAMKNLPTTGSTALLGIDANGNVSTTAALPADLRLVGTGNHISQDAGVGSNGTSAGTGYSNIIVGNGNVNYPAAGNSMTTGYRNIFLGETVGNANTAGYRNTIVGAPSFTANTTGHENTAFGNSTLRFSNGDFNTVVGTYTMNQNTSGSENTAIGANALYENTTGQKNTALGWRALGGAKAGNSNIGVGYNTGINVAGTNNIIIGNELSIQNTAADNQLNIGNLIYATGLGSGATLSTGNVGIGKKDPKSKLAVVGLPVFADNVAAISGSLTAGDFYRTASGVVMVVY